MVTRGLGEGGKKGGRDALGRWEDGARARGIPHLAHRWHSFCPLERKEKAKDQRENRNVK